MKFQYTKPQDVLSPIDRGVEVLNVVHDGKEGSFALAILKWEKRIRMGIRWNSSTNEWDDPDKENGKVPFKGMPVSRGKAIWFILPDDIIEHGIKLKAAFESELKKFLRNKFLRKYE